MQIKLIFTTKVAHLNLIMKVRVFGTRKWPISTVNNELACSRLSDGNDDALVNGTRKSDREPGKREWWRKKKGREPLLSPVPFRLMFVLALSPIRGNDYLGAYWDLQVKVVL